MTRPSFAVDVVAGVLAVPGNMLSLGGTMREDDPDLDAHADPGRLAQVLVAPIARLAAAQAAIRARGGEGSGR